MEPRSSHRSILITVISIAVIWAASSCSGGGAPQAQSGVTGGTSAATVAPTSGAVSKSDSIPTVTANSQWKPVTQTFDGVEMVLIPPGCFQMGTPDDQVAALNKQQYEGYTGFNNEKPVHQVCFDQSIWIDRYEVTNGQFNRLGGRAGKSGLRTDDNQPRDSITWKEADAFCAKRGARLPTEAEWEYAARGPDGLIYPWGNTFVGDNVVYSGSSGKVKPNVGSRPGGVSWVGAYDLSGNVFEWVSDWYDEAYYASSPKVNPRGPSSGTMRVLRGGQGDYNNSDLRAAFRTRDSPNIEKDYWGFRCARSS